MGKVLCSRERYLTAFRQEEPDRVPFDLATSEVYRFPGEPSRRSPLEKLGAIQELGGDTYLDLWLPEPCFHSAVSVKKGYCGRSEEGYPLLFAEYETPAGTLRQIARETPD